MLPPVRYVNLQFIQSIILIDNTRDYLHHVQRWPISGQRARDVCLFVQSHHLPRLLGP